MRHLGLFAIGVIAASCFDGQGTVGAICSDASDCGPKQHCRHELCGRCGDGEHAEREVCYSDREAIADIAGVALLRVVDIDGDNLDDVVVLGTDGTAAVLFAKGGTFARMPLPSPLVARAAALGDVDADGDIDVLLGGGPQIAIARNEGARAFVAGEVLELDADVRELGYAPADVARVTVTFADGGLGWMLPVAGASVTAIDDAGTDVHLGPAFYWDGDQLADFAVVDHRNYRLTILRASAAGFAVSTAVEVGRGPVAVVGIDRNGDDRIDFLTRDREGHSVTIVDGTKNLGLATFDTLAFDHEPTAVSAVDADLDGTTDILVGTSERLELWREIGGRYTESVELSHGEVVDLGVGRFRATPLLDVLVGESDRLTRIEVTP